MKLLFLMFLAGYAKSDDNNYYVVEMEDNDSTYKDTSRPFKVYWNVPTIQCKSKRIPFDDLYEKYGILQNKNDSFRGDEISILYDPGLFPALLKNESSGKYKFRNGGVPQEGNIEEHLKLFRSVLEQSIPDKEFKGVGIIDFESWRPIFRQNFGVLVPYKDVSYEIEKRLHWWWPTSWVQAESKQRFEDAARAFMQTTLSIAKQMRPKAFWGYYGFPYCFNVANKNLNESCAEKVPEENDRLYWLWSESAALLPSVYSSKNLTSSQLAALIRGRVNEAERVKRKSMVLPYFWFRYRDGGYFSEEDFKTALSTLYKSNASGFIIWGSSNDVNTAAKCTQLLEYINNTMGPAIAEYTKPTIKLRDQLPTITHTYDETTSKPEPSDINPDLDPEFQWIPPENYTKDIEQYVEEEIKKKPGYNLSDNNKIINETIYKDLNNSVLIDWLLNYLKENNTDVNQTEFLSNDEKKEFPFIDLTTVSYEQINNDLEASQSVKHNIIENVNYIYNNNLDVSTETASTDNEDKSESDTIANINETNTVNSLIVRERKTIDIYEITTENQSKSITTDELLTTEDISTNKPFFNQNTFFEDDINEFYSTNLATEEFHITNKSDYDKRSTITYASTTEDVETNNEITTQITPNNNKNTVKGIITSIASTSKETEINKEVTTQIITTDKESTNEGINKAYTSLAPTSTALDQVVVHIL